MKKKCAIYCRYSINDTERIKQQKTKLINYCENVLKIHDYEIFVDICSSLKDRASFQKMMKKMKQGVFTDLLVYHTNRIYRPQYNKEKYDSLMKEILSYNVKINSMRESLIPIEESEEIEK